MLVATVRATGGDADGDGGAGAGGRVIVRDWDSSVGKSAFHLVRYIVHISPCCITQRPIPR